MENDGKWGKNGGKFYGQHGLNMIEPRIIWLEL
jgi:hypothetical protein